MSEKNVKIPKWSHAFKRYESSCNVEILKISVKDTESAIQNKLIDLLPELEGFKFVTILVLEFKKIQCDDKTLYCTFYSNSKAEKIINESHIDHVFKSVYSNIISRIQKSQG